MHRAGLDQPPGARHRSLGPLPRASRGRPNPLTTPRRATDKIEGNAHIPTVLYWSSAPVRPAGGAQNGIFCRLAFELLPGDASLGLPLPLTSTAWSPTPWTRIPGCAPSA